MSVKGNKNAVKLKDSEIKQKVYKSYCEHLSKGKSKKSWSYNKDGILLSWITFEKYLLDEVEFDPIHIQIAYSQGYSIWETICEESARGLNPAANTASLQMVMRNKFGWDKPEKDTDPNQAVKKAAIDGFKEEYADGQRSAESPIK